MKPAPFDYHAPTTVEAACQLLAEAGGGAAVLAGGQSLVPLLNLRMSQPFVVVDINRIAELSGISAGPDGVRIGAAVRQCDALTNPALAEHLPAVSTALAHVGHHQTRNRGTIGGSIALGEPAAELPACAVALGAEIEVHSVRGQRRIKARDFYLGPYMTALEPDELIAAIHFPVWRAGHTVLFREVTRRPGDFALVGIVGALEIAEGAVARAGLAWFGMGPTPVAMHAAETALIGQPLATLDPVELARNVHAECAPFDDQHASAEYRRTVARRIFARCLSEAIELRIAA